MPKEKKEEKKTAKKRTKKMDPISKKVKKTASSTDTKEKKKEELISVVTQEIPTSTVVASQITENENNTSETTDNEEKSNANQEYWKQEEHIEHNNKGTKIFGHIVAIVVEMAIVIALNSYYNQIGFLTSNVTDFIWYYNISVFISVIAHLILILFETYSFRHLLDLIKNIFSFYAFWILWDTYPFDFTDAKYLQMPDWLARLIIFIILLATGIAILVHFFKALSGPRKKY